MSEQELEQLSYTDEYASDYLSFDVREYTVSVRNSALAEAIAALSDDKREIILLSYFLDMNDREIGEQLNLLRSNVQYKRTNSLRELKELIERGLKDEYK
jgi:RNA polymerase sigma factor (sigma-70 family)